MTGAVALGALTLFTASVGSMRVRAEREIESHVARARQVGEPVMLSEAWGKPLAPDRNALVAIEEHAAWIEELDWEMEPSPRWLEALRARPLEYYQFGPRIGDVRHAEHVIARALAALDDGCGHPLDIHEAAADLVLDAFDAELSRLVAELAPAFEREGVWFDDAEPNALWAPGGWRTMRLAGVLLATHGRLCVRAHDVDGAQKACERLLWLSDALERQPCHSTFLLRLTLRHDAIDVLHAALSGPLPVEPWMHLEQRIAAWNPWPNVRRSALAERALAIDPPREGDGTLRGDWCGLERVDGRSWFRLAPFRRAAGDACAGVSRDLEWIGDGATSPFASTRTDDGVGRSWAAAHWAEQYEKLTHVVHAAWLVRTAGIDAARVCSASAPASDVVLGLDVTTVRVSSASVELPETARTAPFPSHRRAGVAWLVPQ